MKLFYITNLFSIAIAEEIIRRFKITNPIALIIRNNIEGYYEVMKENMEKQLWGKIEQCPIESYPSELFNVNKFKRLLLYKSLLKKQHTDFTKLLQLNEVEEVFITNIISEDAKILHDVCKKENIRINFYEEGMNLYFDLQKLTSKLKLKIKRLLWGEYKYVTFDRAYFKAEAVFCVFPNKYNFDVCNEKVQIDLKFKLSQEEQVSFESLHIDTLFLSRPLSEDKIISVEDEIETLVNFMREHKKEDIYVKFHPRESAEKIKKIKERIDVKELPDSFKRIPAEKLVLYGDIKTLIGYDTGSLAYASELTDTVSYSLLNRIKGKSNYLNIIYNLFYSEFSKIKFIK